jgi:hypothetical protein
MKNGGRFYGSGGGGGITDVRSFSFTICFTSWRFQPAKVLCSARVLCNKKMLRRVFFK